mmetsp:Transcript_165620/g.531617  ORF Transcript_165620/g.531617 Transcript_165620/m.531617 type:complete len:203 (-) Transcript_165620:8-616(-)
MSLTPITGPSTNGSRTQTSRVQAARWSLKGMLLRDSGLGVWAAGRRIEALLLVLLRGGRLLLEPTALRLALASGRPLPKHRLGFVPVHRQILDLAVAGLAEAAEGAPVGVVVVAEGPVCGRPVQHAVDQVSAGPEDGGFQGLLDDIVASARQDPGGLVGCQRGDVGSKRGRGRGHGCVSTPGAREQEEEQRPGSCEAELEPA